VLSGELENVYAKEVRVELCAESKRGPPVPLSPNHIALTIDARVTAPSSTAFIVCAAQKKNVLRVSFLYYVLRSSDST